MPLSNLPERRPWGFIIRATPTTHAGVCTVPTQSRFEGQLYGGTGLKKAKENS
jgi:hypothetical protein